MKLRQLTIFAVSILLSFGVYAGTYLVAPVEVTDNGNGSGEAQGAMSAARLSANMDEHIGCRLRGDVLNHRIQVQCVAADENGTQVSCLSTEPEIIAAMQAITVYSWILFKFDTSGNCTFLQTSTKSLYVPDGGNLKGK